MNALVSRPLIAAPSHIDWMQDRLIEARGILVDAARYSDSLVILAARLVAGQTDNPIECAEAIDLWRRLDRRPLHAIANSGFSNGGAA